ncbi:MAG: zinc-dependent peptidase [Acidobacteriota bacterium]
MNIISKNDMIFKSVYIFLIFFSGGFLFLYSGKLPFLIITIIILIIYIFLSFEKPLRRLKSTVKKFPEEWELILAKYSNFYKSLGKEGKERFRKDIKIFFTDFTIKGLQGEEIDIETKVLVAAGVATILHGRPYWDPPIKDGVVVYPGETFDSQYELGKGNIAGMAGERRPLLVTKEILKKSFENPGDGYNSLIHELAHYFDFENPELAGIPLIGNEKERAKNWRKIMEEEREKVRKGNSFLRSYAGFNEAEFFAVATEFFFEKPGIMFKENPELYRLLKEFYNLDLKDLYNTSKK